MFFRALRLELQIHRTRLLVLVIGVALLFIASDFSYYSQLYLQNFPKAELHRRFGINLPILLKGLTRLYQTEQIRFRFLSYI